MRRKRRKKDLSKKIWEKPRIVNIDINKMIALHEAGWKNEDIGEEIRMPPLVVGELLEKNGVLR